MAFFFRRSFIEFLIGMLEFSEKKCILTVF